MRLLGERPPDADARIKRPNTRWLGAGLFLFTIGLVWMITEPPALAHVPTGILVGAGIAMIVRFADDVIRWLDR